MTRTGAELQDTRLDKPKAFSQGGPLKRNQVFVYKVYSEKRPDSMNDGEATFYLAVNHISSKNTSTSEKTWFILSQAQSELIS